MKPLDYTRDGSIKEVTKRWFIGTPSLVDLAGELGISESNIFHVTFPDGAKTTLHTHEGGQLLIVTSGTGSMSIFEKTGGGEAEFAIKETDRIPLKQGSIQYIPAGVLHVHGATDGTTLSHIAVNYPSPSGKEPYTLWYESDFASRVTGVL